MGPVCYGAGGEVEKEATTVGATPLSRVGSGPSYGGCLIANVFKRGWREREREKQLGDF